MTDIFGRLRWLIRYSQTSAVRFWFSFASLGMASFLLCSPLVALPGNEYYIMLSLVKQEVWALIFALNGLALLYGVVSRQYNIVLLWLEGVLGMAAWTAAAACMTIAQGAPGASICGAAIAAWICYRYPTHIGRENVAT